MFLIFCACSAKDHVRWLLSGSTSREECKNKQIQLEKIWNEVAFDKIKEKLAEVDPQHIEIRESRPLKKELFKIGGLDCQFFIHRFKISDHGRIENKGVGFSDLCAKAYAQSYISKALVELEAELRVCSGGHPCNAIFIPMEFSVHHIEVNGEMGITPQTEIQFVNVEVYLEMGDFRVKEKFKEDIHGRLISSFLKYVNRSMGQKENKNKELHPIVNEVRVEIIDFLKELISSVRYDPSKEESYFTQEFREKMGL